MESEIRYPTKNLNPTVHKFNNIQNFTVVTLTRRKRKPNAKSEMELYRTPVYNTVRKTRKRRNQEKNVPIFILKREFKFIRF